jgi:hypothetical protein
MEEFEEKFIKPIVNASYPATLAALSLAVLQLAYAGISPTSNIFGPLKYGLLSAAATFLLSAFSIFFYSIYPTRKRLWTAAAITFLAGLSLSIMSVLLLYFS